MKLLEIRKMRGPNYWSAEVHNLIVVKLDVSGLGNMPQNSAYNFFIDLKARMPVLFDDSLSIDTISRKEDWLLWEYASLALKVQQLAGGDCSYKKVIPASEPGVFNVAFEYAEEAGGAFAAEMVLKLCNSLLHHHEFDIAGDMDHLRDIMEEIRLGPSTRAIVDAARARNIPVKRMDCGSFVRFGYGILQKRIQSSVCDTTSNIAVDIASDKQATKELLEKAVLPVPRGMIIQEEKELEEAVDRIGYPLVVKPVDGNHGRGVTTDITSFDTLRKAFRLAKEESHKIIVEKFAKGEDHRFLVINYKLVAVARRIPAAVTGNGASTIQQLIDEVNLDSRRGEGHNRELTLIKVDQVTEMILKDKGLTLDSVLPQGEILYLKDTANLSTGGTAEDVTDIVHPENKFLIERAARIIGLDICGIDVIAPSVERPFKENGGMIIEVNAGPGLRMHVSPSMGRPRNVGEAIVNLLYPEGNGRIPVVAITGTNGKTTTTRLVAHLVSQMGYHVGYTVTDGIFIAGHAIDFGDCTGSRSAEVILSDPLVNFAVLECARGGILRHGLGFDSCDIGIVTNVADDHLGLGDINTIEEMAKVKSVVPRSVAPSGYSILNADDDLVYAMASDIVSKLALFSLDANSPRITEHCEKGGLAAVVDNGYITIIDGNKRIQIEKAENIPLTMKGKAIFMIQNVLPAVLVGYINKFPEKEIRLGLMTFHPSVDQTPGRLNVFNFPHFDVLVDYAHNTHGYKALGKFLSSIRDRHKVGIVAAVGDRRDEDIMNVGRLAAEMFDEIIIRQDHDLRGRTVEEIMSLIEQGIKQVRNKPVISIPNELDAIHYAFQNAKNGSMIVICTDMIKEVLDYVKSEHEKYSHEDQYHE